MKNKEIYKVNAFEFKAILADKTIPPGAKLVLFNLQHRLGGKMFAFPSQKTIGKDIGLSDRQVRYHLKTLKNRGIISWSRGTYNPKTGNRLNSNHYDLTKILQTVTSKEKQP